MAVALTPNAFLNRSATTAWDVYFSWCGWRRIDTDRGQTTVLTYLGHSNLGSGFQITADASRKLIVYRVNNFSDLLGGAGPTLAVGTWYFFGLTTIAASQADGIEIYYAAEGAGSLTQVTATFLGPYNYLYHGVGGRSDGDGEFGAYRLHGSAWGDRTWQNQTLTPTEMLAEFQSETPVKTLGLWSSWPMETAAAATTDASGNSRPLTATTGTGTITDTDSPDFGTTVEGTASATWGPWTGTSSGTVTEGVIEGTSSTTWGGWNGFAEGDVIEAVTTGSASGTWGPWTGTAQGQVITDIIGGTASATWGPWTGTAQGQVTETKVDITVSVAAPRNGRGTVGEPRASWTVGPPRIDRGN